MKNSIFKATLFVSVLVIFCKLLGFARESIIAAYYGANAQTDAFFFAQGMPASIFPSICNSISTAFTTVYVRKKMELEWYAEKKYVSSMLLATTITGIFLSFLGCIFARFLVPFFAPGFNGEQLNLAIHLTQLIMAAFFLTMLQYMLSALLNSNKLFYVAQIANIVNNILVIVITIIVGKSNNIDLLTVSVIFGLCINVAVLFIYSRKYIAFSFNGVIFGKDYKDLIKLSLPIILGNGVVQINTIVDKALGSTLTEGSLSSLSYAGTLNAMVIGVFIMSLSTVLYPNLTEKVALGDMEQFVNIIVKSLGLLSFVLIYISFFTCVNAREIIGIVFERGNFGTLAAETTAIVLSAYSFLYVFTGLREVLTRVLFSMEDTKTPMINSSIGVAINIVLSVFLVHVIGIVGIPIGTVISNIIITILLLRVTMKRIPELKLKAFFISLIKQTIAGIVMTVILYLCKKYIPINNYFLSLVCDVIVSGTVYICVLLLLRCNELQYIMHKT